MRCEYQMSNKAGKKHLFHLLKLLAVGAVMVVLTIILGLTNFKESQYPFVYFLLIALAFLSINALALFGGRLDGTIDKKAKQKKFLIKSGIIAAAVWVLLAIMGFPLFISGFMFIGVIVLVVMLCARLVEMLLNVWNMLVTVDNAGNKLNYPGDVVLHDVHTADAMTSSFGKVILYRHAVLFVLPELRRGFVEVHPNGTMQIKKTALFNDNKIKENGVSVSTITAQAEDGTRRVMQTIEKLCEKHGIDSSDLIYNYVFFMPNFDSQNVAWDFQSFIKLPTVRFWTQDKQYQDYLKKASYADYFNGRACYTTRDLYQTLEAMNTDAALSDNTDERNEKLGALLAEEFELEVMK